MRGKLSRRYALPGNGSGTGTMEAIGRSGSNVAPQSKDRVKSCPSLWKSSHATYTSPRGPTATVVPWFWLFGGWLRWMIGVHERPPSVDRWNTMGTDPPALSNSAHGMYRYPSHAPPVSSTAIHSLSVTREFPAYTTDVKSYVAPKSEYRVRTTQPANSVVRGPKASHARYTRPSRSAVITGSLPIDQPASCTGEETPSGDVSPGNPGTSAFVHVAPPSVDR